MKLPQKVTKRLGYICKKICYHDVSEIAQSGRTVFCATNNKLLAQINVKNVHIGTTIQCQIRNKAL